ncbi:MAG: radical SAM protein [Planctomycetaceae bacterium]|nr:radical SAM protein [Planctomycetaceae bacterium]
MNDAFHQLIRNHTRSFQEQKYVYPVVSRRSHGVSIGINLSPTGLCNFRCIYCQIDGDLKTGDQQTGGASPRDETLRQCRLQHECHSPLIIDLALLEAELRETLEAALNGELFCKLPFSETPPDKRRINDIAFSGDGEPTLSPQFFDAVQIAVRVRDDLQQQHFPPALPLSSPQQEQIKIVLITNATTLHKPEIRDAVDYLAGHHGEIWAKLDAGTADYYQKIDRSKVPFEMVLANLAETACRLPLVIQSLFLRMHDEPPSDAEVGAYIDRLKTITTSGGTIKLVQLYTIARNTAEPWATPLPNTELDAIAKRIRNETRLNVETYYGAMS